MLTSEPAMDVSLGSREGWLKTKEPQSIKEWKWMSQHVWATKYDFSTQLKLKKKQKRKSCVKYFQTSICESPARGYVVYKKKRFLKKHKQHVSKTKKQIRVFVRTPLSTTLNLTVDRMAQVSTVKDLLSERLGIAAEKQDLFVGSLKMCNLLTLEDHGVGDQCNITLKLGQGLLGGADKPEDSSSNRPTPNQVGALGPAVNIHSGNITSAAPYDGDLSTSAANVLVSDNSDASRPIQKTIIGDHNIVVDTGPNSTVNISNPQEVHEIKIRLTKVEEENEALRRHVQVQDQRFQSLVMFMKDRIPELAQFFDEKGLGRLDGYGPGSVYLFVRFSQRQQLDKLWKMYTDGSLKKELTKILLFEEGGRRKTANIDMDVFIDEAEYLQGIRLFETRVTDQATSQEQLPPIEKWSTDRLHKVLLMEGVSESTANKFLDEEIDGQVFALYRKEDLKEDFDLKLGPFRKLLYVRDKYLKLPSPTQLPSDMPPENSGSLETSKGHVHDASEMGKRSQPSQPETSKIESATGTRSKETKSKEKGKGNISPSKPKTCKIESAAGARPKEVVKTTVKEARKDPHVQVQKDVKRGKMIDIEKRVRSLLLGNDQYSLDESYYPVLVGNKPSGKVLSSGESTVENLSFVTNIDWKVVFDFYGLSNSDGLCQYFSETNKPNLQLPETALSTNIGKLEEVDDPVWIFCNGREDDANVDQPVLSRPKWNEERSKDVEEVVSKLAQQSIMPSPRSVIIFLILSEDQIGILSDTFRKFFSAFHGMDNITCITESEDLYKRWEEEVQRWCEVDVLKSRSVVGVPLSVINNIMHRMSQVNITSDMKLPLSARNHVSLSERDVKKWKDISVVCLNECENTDMNEDHPEFETFNKDKELQFYKGHKPEWWNFILTDGDFNSGQGYNHILRRTHYDKLQMKITSALQGVLSRDLVVTITMFHQPGCGATTLARHQLWGFHQEYRCITVDRVTPTTAKQILAVWKYKYNRERDCLPVLVLVDDLEDPELTDLIADLENLSKEFVVRGVLCVLLHCKRTPDPEMLFKRSDQRLGFVLQQTLEPRERDWFDKKYHELERKEKMMKTGDYQPERLIAFMVMKEECNPKYVKKVVSEALGDVATRSTKEYKLVKYAAVLSSYLNGAVIPVACCDEFMAESKAFHSRRQVSTKKEIPWEKTMSPASQMLLIKVQILGIGQVHGIKIVHRCVAEEIIQQISEEKDQTLADIVLELLNSNLLRSVSHSKDYLISELRDLLVRRKKYDLGDNEETQFSPLVEQVYLSEKPRALEVLENGSELLSYPQCVQQAARLCYIREKNYSKAHTFARKAIEQRPSNPYMMDTEAQIFRAEIKNNYIEKYYDKNKVLPMKESKHLIHLAKSAIEIFEEGQRFQGTPTQNISSFFSEVDIAFRLIQILDHCSPVFRSPGGRDKLKEYLLTEAIPDGLDEWETFHPFFKSIKSTIDIAMQNMDNFLTFCKDASSQNLMAHELDLKKRQQRRLHSLYVEYFGESLDAKLPPNADLADWRRRQVSAIGADNFHRIFELAKNRDVADNSAKLKKVMELLSENTPSTYFDIRNIIFAILALSSMGEQERKQLPHVDDVYEMVMELIDRAAHLDNEIYGPFFTLMFLWPHPDDTIHRIKPPQTLKGLLNDLKRCWEAQWADYGRDIEEDRPHPYGRVRHRKGRRKPLTFFFLAQGKGLSRYLHINELNTTTYIIQSERQQFWDKPQIKGRLTVLNGTLYNNTHLSYKTPTDEQLLIRLALPTREVESQEPVTFYLGFSWEGPVAYYVKSTGSLKSDYRPVTFKKAYPRYLIRPRLSDEAYEALQTKVEQTQQKTDELQKHLQKLEKFEKKKASGGRLTGEQIKKLKRKPEVLEEIATLEESIRTDMKALELDQEPFFD